MSIDNDYLKLLTIDYHWHDMIPYTIWHYHNIIWNSFLTILTMTWVEWVESWIKPRQVKLSCTRYQLCCRSRYVSVGAHMNLSLSICISNRDVPPHRRPMIMSLLNGDDGRVVTTWTRPGPVKEHGHFVWHFLAKDSHIRQSCLQCGDHTFVFGCFCHSNVESIWPDAHSHNWKGQ